MELGNWAFGNSRGEYEVPREWQDDFCGHLRAMGFSGYGSPVEWDDNGAWAPHISDHLDVYCRKITGNEGGTHRRYETDVFVIMPYYRLYVELVQIRSPRFLYEPRYHIRGTRRYAPPLRGIYSKGDDNMNANQVTVTLPTIPKEVADTIEVARLQGACNGTIIDVRNDDFTLAGVSGAVLRLISLDTLLAALVNGYVVEKSAEELERVAHAKIRRKYAVLPCGEYETGYDEGIKFTLNTLGIKIEGVNA